MRVVAEVESSADNDWMSPTGTAAVDLYSPERFQASPGRWRWWLTAAAAALVLIGLTVGWLLLRDDTSEPAAGTADGEPPFIVVLPFENLGPPEHEYFADGMTEELISRLAEVDAIRVISRTTKSGACVNWSQ